MISLIHGIEETIQMSVYTRQKHRLTDVENKLVVPKEEKEMRWRKLRDEHKR